MSQSFQKGLSGAHQVINKTDEPVRVVLFSSKSPLAVVHYPDSGKVGIWTADRSSTTGKARTRLSRTTKEG